MLDDGPFMYINILVVSKSLLAAKVKRVYGPLFVNDCLMKRAFCDWEICWEGGFSLRCLVSNPEII